MALSDHERRRLEELETDLAAEDPVLDRELATGRPPRWWLRRSVSVALLLIGFAVMILGIAAQLPGLGFLGFLLMFCGACGYVGRSVLGS